MSKQELTHTFCTVLKDFLSDMYNSYPDASLMMLRQMTSGMIMTDPNGVVVNFMYCVDKYTTKILSKDESFFLDGGLEGDLSQGEYSFLLDELKKISTIWRDPGTSAKTKASIWKYLQILVKLGKSISKM
jgi:hypothetical protein